MRGALVLEPAAVDDAAAIAALRNAVSIDLTRRYGKGHWSSQSTERGVIYQLRTSSLYVMRDPVSVIASLRLARKKPWAIDVSYFTPRTKPIYLTDMAVAPERQGRGLGRACLDQVRRIGASWPADTVRLDAWNADAGAGGFYARCGYREVGRVTYRGAPLIYFETLL